MTTIKKPVGEHFPNSPLPFFGLFLLSFLGFFFLISEIRVVYLTEICASRCFKGKTGCRAKPALPAKLFFVPFIVVFAPVCQKPQQL